MCENCLGTQLVCGKPSKLFHPFIMPGGLDANIEGIHKKLMVDFDPFRCFVKDLEVTTDVFDVDLFDH